MATIKPYETKSGKRFRVRYRQPDGSQTDRRGFKTKRDAEAFANTVEVAKLRGEYVSHTAGRTTVSEIGEQRLRARKATIKPSSWNTESAEWRNRVEPRWGDRAVSSIKPSEVSAWIGDMSAQKLSASVVSRAHGILRGILQVAVDDNRLAKNPAANLPLPKKVAKPRNYLSHIQVDRLASACLSPEKELIVRFLCYTGLRWGEMAGLRVKYLDMVRRRILVEENAATVGGVPTKGTPKTHEKRSVPFPKFLVAALTKQCHGRGADDLVFGSGTSYVFTPRWGDGWLENAIARVRAEDTKLAEVTGDAIYVFPRVTVHDFRHTAASLAISAGATPKAVQRMLGHASAAMTLDTYADLFEDDLDAVADALDKARAVKVGSGRAQKNVGKKWATRRRGRRRRPRLPRDSAGVGALEEGADCEVRTRMSPPE